MKKRLKNVLLPLLVAISMGCFAQNNSVGIGTITPDNSAILDLVSTNQGLLIPRNNTFGITSIAAPSDGLILYNTDDKCYWFWNNTSWKRLCETDSLLTLITNLGDTIGFIYDSLAVYNNLVTINTTNITNNTTNIQNLSDSLGWVYDSLAVYNNLVNTNITNIATNTTNINNLYDSVDVINNHLVVVDSTLLNKWDIYGNTGTNPTTNFLGTTDNQALSFRVFNNMVSGFTSSGTYFINGAFSANLAGWQGLTSNVGIPIPMTSGLQFIPIKNALRIADRTDLPYSTDYYKTDSIGYGSFAYGRNAKAKGDYSLSGGLSCINNAYNSVAFGYSNVTGGDNFTYGTRNPASGASPLSHNIVGGISNIVFGDGIKVTGSYNFILGHTVNTTRSGGAIITDWTSNDQSSAAVISPTGNYMFYTRFAGGYRFYTNILLTTGVILNSGSGTWASVSDENLKTNITLLDYSLILEKYRDFEIKKWSYIGQTVDGQDKDINEYEQDIFHIGVMAQDFYKAFGLGVNNTTITTLDIAGVNSAAIKALLEKIDNQDTVIAELKDLVNKLMYSNK